MFQPRFPAYYFLFPLSLSPELGLLFTDWLAGWTHRPRKVLWSHLETPKDASQKTNITKAAHHHWLRRSHHFLDSHTTSEHKIGLFRSKFSFFGEWTRVISTCTYLSEGILHLINCIAFIFTGQKMMLWKKRENVNTLTTSFIALGGQKVYMINGSDSSWMLTHRVPRESWTLPHLVPQEGKKQLSVMQFKGVTWRCLACFHENSHLGTSSPLLPQ